MASTTGVLNEAQKLIRKQLSDLDDERRRLERALTELGGKTRRRGPGRPRGSKAVKPASAPRRRRRRGGRADQAVRLIEKNPGITVSDIAKKLKTKPTNLYRVLGDLEKAKRVKKQGRKYHPAG